MTFTALSEPNRFRIVELLRNGPLPVGKISDDLELRQPQVSKHLRVLAEAGIVKVQPNAQQRIYQLQPRPFQELNDWAQSFNRLWEQRLDAFEAYLKRLQTEESARNRRKRTPGRTRHRTKSNKR